MNAPPNPSASVPISTLWDQDVYKGTNPEDTWTTDAIISRVGLAEYANANYFSEDTIFSDYPHPRKENTTAKLVEQYAKNGKLDKTWYVMGYQTERLAAYSYFWDNSGLIPETKWLYHLDNFVYKSYADNLIPRAVGYSAGLLNYFFRGTLEITSPDQYAYSVIDGSESPQQFAHIKAKVKNKTQGEQAGEGIVQAVAKYKKIPNYREDLSNYPLDGNAMKAIEYSYSVSEPVTVDSLSDTDPEEFTFDFSGDPIPVGITDLYLQVIFKGTLGNERDIAVAVGMKALTEPTHQVFWNLTDMFALEGHLYTESQITGNPDLLRLVDLDRNGKPNDPGEPYISPRPLSLEIAYSGDTSLNDPFYLAAVAQIPEGGHIRLIALFDKEANNVMGIGWSGSTDPGGLRHFSLFSAVVNQIDGNGAWQAKTPVESFREAYGPDGTLVPIKQHLHEGVLGCEPMGTGSDGAPVCPYPENEAIPAPSSAPIPATIYYP
jgi:hypothetical protein